MFMYKRNLSHTHCYPLNKTSRYTSLRNISEEKKERRLGFYGPFKISSDVPQKSLTVRKPLETEGRNLNMYHINSVVRWGF